MRFKEESTNKCPTWCRHGDWLSRCTTSQTLDIVLNMETTFAFCWYDDAPVPRRMGCSCPRACCTAEAMLPAICCWSSGTLDICFHESHVIKINEAILIIIIAVNEISWIIFCSYMRSSAGAKAQRKLGEMAPGPVQTACNECQLLECKYHCHLPEWEWDPETCQLKTVI